MRNLQLNIDYGCKVTGGSNYYMSRDTKAAHSGLKITEDEWKVSMKCMARALASCKVLPRERKEVLTLVEKRKHDIVLS